MDVILNRRQPKTDTLKKLREAEARDVYATTQIGATLEKNGGLAGVREMVEIMKK